MLPLLHWAVSCSSLKHWNPSWRGIGGKDAPPPVPKTFNTVPFPRFLAFFSQGSSSCTRKEPLSVQMFAKGRYVYLQGISLPRCPFAALTLSSRLSPPVVAPRGMCASAHPCLTDILQVVVHDNLLNIGKKIVFYGTHQAHVGLIKIKVTDFD